jgi:alpha-tubulin suppressor-like RCC1 family protein
MSKRNGEGAHFIPVPKIVPYMKKFEVKQVVAGWGHTAVLTKLGEVLICGRNLQGQLGLGDPNNFPKNEREHPYQAQFVPIPTLSHCKIKQIACGGEHSVALGVDNKVYTFGAGNKGQLGHESQGVAGRVSDEQEAATTLAKSEYVPRLVGSIRKTRRDIHQVACGNNCTLILAGCFNPPTLMERCIEVISETPELIEQLEYLPTELSELVKSSLSAL